MGMQYKIALEHVSKAYAMYNSPKNRFKEAVRLSGKSFHTDFFALKDISFSVRQGEIVGIMGRNGAGKSTLLEIISGILSPTSGKVTVSGRISSLLELGTGFNMEYTGIENLFFYGTLMGLTDKQVEERLDAILSFAEIGDYIYQPVKTYSSGMFARLAFAAAINVEPDILIVDEILSVGDIRFQAKCFNKFKEFKKNGVTILYVGHDVGIMKAFCDRCIWLDQGQIIMDGFPSDVAAKYVAFMYLEDSGEFTNYKRRKDEPVEEPALSLPVQKKAEKSADAVPQHPGSDIFPDALAHWGTKVGMVSSVFIETLDGKPADYFAPEDTIRFGFVFQAQDIDFSVFSIAVSIKNKEGTDIIVKTSFDEGLSLVGEQGKTYVASFTMKTYLAVGEYYLVVALENRKELVPMYYEYIDGAKFFKVYTDKKIYGKVDIPAEIEFREVKENG